ncbi:hypothetical protein GCM10028807_50580 [Spirosoma daeguense]
MNKKETILQAAMSLLVSNGLQATPMSAIAKAAGTGMGTIYNYFSTKEELVNAIYLFIKEEELSMLQEPFSEDSIKFQFDYYYSSLVHFYLNNPTAFAFMDQFQNSPIITKETKEAGVKTLEPITSLLQKGQKQGLIKAMDLQILIQFLGGTLTSYVRWALSANNKTTETTIAAQLKLTWDAVKQ